MRCRPSGESVGSRVSRIDGLIDGLIDSRLHARSGPLLSAKISRTTLLARTQITSERAPSPRPRRRGKHGVHRRCPGCGVRGGRIDPRRARSGARFVGVRPRSARARPWAASSSRRPPPILPAALRQSSVASTRAAIADGPAASASDGARKPPSRRRTSTARLVSRGAQPRPALRTAPSLDRTSSRPSSRTGASSRRTSATRRRSCSSPSSAERRPVDTPSSARGRTWRCVSAPPRRRAPPGSRTSRANLLPLSSPLEDAANTRSIDRSISIPRLGVFDLGVDRGVIPPRPVISPRWCPHGRLASLRDHRRPLFVPRDLPLPARR